MTTSENAKGSGQPVEAGEDGAFAALLAEAARAYEAALRGGLSTGMTHGDFEYVFCMAVSDDMNAALDAARAAREEGVDDGSA